MQSPWMDLEECSAGHISNFDCTIDGGVEDELRAGKFCDYAGRNFIGKVWFDGEQFNCEVYRFRQLAGLVAAPSLKELMGAVSRQYESAS